MLLTTYNRGYFFCYLCIAWTVTNNQTFISLAITFQNNKIVRHSDAPISPKNVSRAEAETGTVGARINEEVNY
jgi:hypothetical protein